MSELEAAVAALKQQNLEQDRRLKNLERTNKAISELTFVTKELVEAVQKLTEVQQAHDARLERLERAPGEHLVKIKDTIVVAIISAACGALVTWVVSTLL